MTTGNDSEVEPFDASDFVPSQGELIEVIDLPGGAHAILYSTLDEDPDTSWLGEYAQRIDEYTIDRKDGIYYGRALEWSEVERRQSHPTAIERRAAESAECEPWDLENYEVLSYDIGHDWGTREYRYFRVSENYTPPGESSGWANAVDASGRVKIYPDGCKKRWGRAPKYRRVTPRTADIFYAVSDYNRMEDYNRGGWYMLGVLAKIVDASGREVGGASVWGEVSGASVWGIESDSGSDYIRETALSEAREALAELAKADPATWQPAYDQVAAIE